jgi:hypothetical protein
LEFDFYAKASCRQLCEKVANTLPRELRDDIYGHVHPSQVIEVTTSRPNQSDTELGTSLSFKEFHSDIQFPSGTYYFQLEYVGHQFQREIIEEWYRNSDLILKDANLVGSFCFQSLWTTGVTPSQWIRHVTLEFLVVPVLLNSGDGITISDSIRALKPLLKCRNGLVITINAKSQVRVAKASQPVRKSTAWVEKVFPMLRRLVKQGQEVQLVFEAGTTLSSAVGEFTLRTWLDRLAYTDETD